MKICYIRCKVLGTKCKVPSTTYSIYIMHILYTPKVLKYAHTNAHAVLRTLYSYCLYSYGYDPSYCY